MTKKRLDKKTLFRMNLENSPDSKKLYEFDEPITSVQIFNDEYGGQGNAPFYAVFFHGDKALITAAAKGNAMSLTLTTCEEDENGMICADPRIVATYILGAWLDHAFSFVDEYNKNTELTEALNPVFTRDEALKWLEDAGFIGFNNYNNPFKIEDKTKWFKNPRYPGFDIYLDEPDIPKVCVPAKAKKLYDKYFEKYLEALKQIEEEQMKEDEED